MLKYVKKYNIIHVTNIKRGESMARQDFNIQSILDIPHWEKIQDKLAQLTGTAIICIDYKGNPVTKHSARTDFCSVIRENPISRKRCFRCDALAGLEAVRLERPYIYLCHCGIVDVAVPVMVGDRYLGSVMFGQVRLPNKDEEKAVRLVNEISSFQPEEESSRHDLLEMYEKLPEMEYDRIVEIAGLIASLVDYMVHKAVNNRYREQTYEWMYKLSEEHGHEKELTQAIEPLDILPENDTADKKHVSMSSPVYPAVEFIHNHPKEKVSMKSMALLCRISESHFSRTFSRDVGENFVSYVNRNKINQSKQLLRNSNKTISQIAAEFGYADTSNYISIFKKFEGITPQVYRQYKYK